MRFAIVDGAGRVTNVAEASPEFAVEVGWIALPEGASVDWHYDGETFSPPPEPPVDLETRRAEAMREIVEHINEITRSALTAYPTAEVESWSIQKAEAEAVIDAGNTLTIDVAPFLASVCEAQFGPASVSDRIEQVRQKALEVKANADAWGAMAAYVNGLRARTQLAIQAAEDVEAINAALSAGIDEGNAFKEANGL